MPLCSPIMSLHFFWDNAILAACYLINCVPTRVLQHQTPLNTLLKSYPEICFFSTLPLRVFGCISFVQNHSKLDPRVHKCILLGYSATQNGYICYFPEKRKYFVSLDVTLFENQSFYTKNSLHREN